MALQISIHSGGPNTIGINWISRFLHRQPAICTKIGRKMDALRIQNTNPEDLQARYSLVQQKKKTIKSVLLRFGIWMRQALPLKLVQMVE
jgi:hypothetical protein